MRFHLCRALILSAGGCWSGRAGQPAWYYQQPRQVVPLGFRGRRFVAQSPRVYFPVSEIIISCVMIRMDPQELRERARNFRSIALDGDDLHLKAALLELAADFEREAMETEMQAPIECPAAIHDIATRQIA
jgi:hypothetical protein